MAVSRRLVGDERYSSSPLLALDIIVNPDQFDVGYGRGRGAPTQVMTDDPAQAAQVVIAR
jgi:hypothetical protein